MNTDEKVRENRLRRAADRQRVTLTKSRRRDPKAWDYGRYWLHDQAGNRICPEEGLTIDQVEQHLVGDDESADDERRVGTPVG
ncbi:hypothetical protein ACFYPX_18195 [Micromonospora zamorensis]|uniref:hypothetical protein n=1 Tax=Micromonospora zamorensis TaxID=709883 RepID=UPI0036C452C3